MPVLPRILQPTTYTTLPTPAFPPYAIHCTSRTTPRYRAPFPGSTPLTPRTTSPFNGDAGLDPADTLRSPQTLRYYTPPPPCHPPHPTHSDAPRHYTPPSHICVALHILCLPLHSRCDGSRFGHVVVPPLPPHPSAIYTRTTPVVTCIVPVVVRARSPPLHHLTTFLRLYTDLRGHASAVWVGFC